MNTFHLVRLIELTRDITSSMAVIDQARAAGNTNLVNAKAIHIDWAYRARLEVSLNAVQDGIPVRALMWVTQQATPEQLMRLVTDGPLIEDSVMLMAIQAQLNAATAEALIDRIEATHGPRSSKPKAKAPKAVTPVTASDAERLAMLKACATEQEARAFLDVYRVSELRGISRANGSGTQSKLRRAELVDSLVFATVGMREAHNAIRNAK